MKYICIILQLARIWMETVNAEMYFGKGKKKCEKKLAMMKTRN